VKLRDVASALGFRGRPREYGYDIATFQLPKDGEIQLARWRHPGEKPKTVTQASVDALRRFLAEGDVAVDIGAHTGDTSVPIALAAGARGRVFALEPNPYVFKVLAVNATLNPGKTRISPLMFAATPEDGAFEFEYSDAGFCNGGLHQGIARWRHGHFHRLRVAGRNLAAYLREHAPEDARRVRYIKIDTEGFDRAVVRSLRELIAGVRPYIKTEIYRHLPADERTGYGHDLKALGYRLFKCEGESEYRGDALQPDDLTRWTHFDVFAIPEEKS
jgi:FkbM family methyltransferase